jgi:hypothetical protein
MCSITSSGSTIRIDDIRLLDLLARQSMKELLGYLRTVSGKTGEAQVVATKSPLISLLIEYRLRPSAGDGDSGAMFTVNVPHACFVFNNVSL